MDWREKIKRLTAGIVASKVAEDVGLPPAAITKAVSTGQVPKIDKAIRIAKALRVPVEWLFDDSRDWPPPFDGGVLESEVLEAAIQEKRRIGGIYEEIQTRYERFGKGLKAKNKSYAADNARALLQLCDLYSQQIDAWYRFSIRWRSVQVYSARSPEWRDLSALEPALIELLKIDYSEIPQALRHWAIDCAEWIAFTLDKEASPLDQRFSRTREHWPESL